MKEESNGDKMITIDMHATGVIASASKTITVISKKATAPSFCEIIRTSGGEVSDMFSTMSSLGYFLYNWGIRYFQLAVFRRDC